MAQDTSPKMADYANTHGGMHAWAQAMARWNSEHGILSEDLIKQWNEQRKNT